MKWLCIDFLLVQPFQQKLKNTTFFWNRLYLVKNRTRLVTFFWQGRTSLVRFFTRYSRFQKNVVFLSFCWNGCTSKKSIQSHFIYYNAKDSTNKILDSKIFEHTIIAFVSFVKNNDVLDIMDLIIYPIVYNLLWLS